MKKIIYPGLVGEMAKHGHTQTTLGKILGVTYSAVSRKLSGQTEWSISEIEKVCDFYGKDYYELFKRDSK